MNNDVRVSYDNNATIVSKPDKNEVNVTVDSPEEYPSLPSPSSLKRNQQQKRSFQNQQQQLQQYRQQHQHQQQPQNRQHHQQPQNRQQQQLQRLNQLPPQSQLSKPKVAEQPVNVITINSNQEAPEEVDEDEEGDEDEEDEEEDDDDVEEYISEDEDQPFSFPGFIDDNAPSLNNCAREKPFLRNVQYYTLRGQYHKDAIKCMLKYYNSWHKAWCSLEKNNILPEDNHFIINNIKRNSLINDDNSLPSTSKSTETSFSYSPKITNNDAHSNRKTVFEKSSSPDIEEVEITEIRSSGTVSFFVFLLLFLLNFKIRNIFFSYGKKVIYLCSFTSFEIKKEMGN